MTLKQNNDRPSTPPSSVPTSPTDSREVMLLTPLKLSRPRRTSFAPATPQSLKSPRSPLALKNIDSQFHMLTPLRNPASINIPNWRVPQDSPSEECSSQNFQSPDNRSSIELATPSRYSGPFTPQLPKQSRDPLHLNSSNYTSTENHRVRGSLTDPPPRRRIEQPWNSDKNTLDSGFTRALDVTLPAFETQGAIQKALVAEHPDLQNSCASCGGSARLSLLQPCQHHICASCMAGSLDLAGGNNLICMRCSTSVHAFKIASSPERIHSNFLARHDTLPFHTIPSSNMFDAFNLQSDTPFKFLAMNNSSFSIATPRVETVVLRIENVPWDITPPMLDSWLDSPIVHCHVLLDRKDGRTLSHAYIEVTAEVARDVLRSHQNKVLGCGRRLRPVTLARSSQEELMHDLFPSWAGKFKGTAPVHTAANGSSEPPIPEFLTRAELYVMAHLVQSPGSHFLKVPSLAYWSLVSTLVKFPAPDVFAPAPDLLFDITICALEKYETMVGTREYDCVLHTKLIAAAIHCQAFTDSQLQILLRFTDCSISRINPNLAPNMNSSMTAQHFHHELPPPHPRNPIQHTWNEGSAQHRMDPGLYETMDPCDRVAQDFGIDPSLVYALAERLTLHSSSVMRPLGQLR